MTATELIDIIYPEHDRTSCDDENLSNSFYFEDDGTQGRSRCIRCSLLVIAEKREVLLDTFNPNDIIY